MQAAWNGEAASVAVTSFPDAAENAEYTVRCVWNTAVWEKKYTVHFLDLSGKQSPRLRPAADGNFWTARAGEPLNPQNCFTVVCDWTPSGGKPFVISAEAGAAVLEHFTADPEAGTITPDDPGGYDFDLKLTLANVSWTVPYTLYVTREDGTVPAGSFRSQSGSTLNLPAGLKRIGAWAFSGSSAEIVMIPEACTEIEEWAFSNMQNLREITIPSSVTVIGENVFTGSGSFAVYAYSDAAVETALGYEGLLVLTE